MIDHLFSNFSHCFRIYVSVCLSNIKFDIVVKVLQLIYRGAVEVPSCQMRSFVRAAKYLRLQGFENIAPTLTVNDIRDGGQVPARKKGFSIILKRIDDDENFAMVASSSANDEHSEVQSNQPTMTNGGDDPMGGNNADDNSSDSSEFGSDNGGNGGDDDGDNGDNGNNGNNGNDDKKTGNNITCQENGYALSSSSSESFESASDSDSEEHAGTICTS